MGDIRLFVCCHRKENVPEHPLMRPIQVGAALSDRRFDGFQQDDEGENISLKNRSYCELTAQYWAWKNVKADYCGFFHYRRYLYPDTTAKRPYIIRTKPTDALLERLGYGSFAELIRQYDLIAPIGEDMRVSVREHYQTAPHHRGKDLALAEEIVARRHPEMKAAMESYLSGTVHYFGNMYIMRREMFADYCAWLFPILEEFDRHADLTGYSPQELRVDGYLAERLFGIYYTHMKRALSVLELPRVHFHTGRDYLSKQLTNVLLPPGSARRAAIKWLRQRGKKEGF